jgi:N-acetylmuramoyl-L-alanine amidase
MTRPPEPPVPADTAAAGTQPGPIPPINNTLFRADTAHYQPGRTRPITLICIHNTEATGSGDAPSGRWLSTDPNSAVSIHHLYGRSGTRYDLVHRVDTAWHAGVSEWHGTRQCNAISVGHELESSATATDAGDGYTDGQYAALAYTVACEMVQYRIALPAGRRHDPSAFNWDRFKRLTDAWRTFLQAVPPAEHDRWFI